MRKVGLASEWPTWDLQQPPSGEDGRRWSARWFLPNAVNRWGRQAAPVAQAIAELEAIPNCWHVEVEPETWQIARGVPLRLVVTASLELEPDALAYRKPTRIVELQPSNAVAGRIAGIADLSGPPAPADEIPDDPECLEAAVARQVVRRLGSKDLPNKAGEPLRRRLLKAIGKSPQQRIPRGRKPAFTDMWPQELTRVVREAELLATAVQTSPDEVWLILMPEELDRVLRPPPVGGAPSDYGERLNEGRDYPDELARLRPASVLAHDLTLLRLGRDPDDERQRTALRVALNRARAQRGR